MMLIALTPNGPGQIGLDPAPLGRGGEGTVYSVKSHSLADLPSATELVAKLYHEPSADNRMAKVRAMVSAPPHSSSVAWPLALVYRQDKTFAGYVMMKLDSSSFRPWSELAHARSRRESAPRFDARYGLTAIRNLAIAVHSVHQAGHRVGDINESNIFCGADARVLLVDTDSAQVTSNNVTFPCPVGKPEYTAPELSHGNLRDQARTEASDTFGFAVAAYQMMTGGAHPTDAVFEGEGEAPSVTDKIRAGAYPGLAPATAGALRHPPRIAAQAIPASLRAALFASLSVNPAQRPSLPSLVAVIDEVLPHLTQCTAVEHHWYDGRENKCGWCAHVQQGQADPWSDQAATAQSVAKQYTLPAVNFGDNATPVQVRRAPAAPISSQSPAASAYPQASYPTPQPNGSSAPQSPSSPPPAPQAAPQAPVKQKQGGKTILTYADGSQRVRPPLALLFKANPKLALSCLKSETPDFARFWWPTSRDLAQPTSLGFGLIISFTMAMVWLMTIPSLASSYAGAPAAPLIMPAAYVAGMGTVLTGVYLAFSGFWDRMRAKKASGDLDKFKKESVQRTSLRFLGISFVYGPLLLLGIVAGATLAAFNFLAAILQENRR